MADSIADKTISANQWQDITGSFIATNQLVFQNKTGGPVHVWLGSSAPASWDSGVVVPDRNWPQLEFTLTTKVWVYSANGGKATLRQA